MREITSTIDGRGRISIPSSLKVVVEQPLLIMDSRGCLRLCSALYWQGKVQNIIKDSKGRERRRIKRRLYSRAFDVKIDVQGRVLIPLLLRDGFSSGKKAVFLRKNNFWEIWEKEALKNYQREREKKERKR